ncbi:hypothetical protein BD410DRAFT_779730 [Rickenella mellea]|uniref:WIBG Mago-binding domain-containing protein n=1 Tax=Rickenella mellea TaxID=50990 RepID=A0A4R5XE32_9AGAM|nr:hypothetical protein BD410DRAFT_779730 [Rickenella mellea]
MSKPPVYPEQSVSGIAIDPRTLERVIPESKRPDGSVRKPLKVRPGFTPQEDISRFRGRRQQQMDSNTLPKGHILGWIPPTDGKAKVAAKPSQNVSSSAAAAEKPLTKAAAKNAKRKAKRQAEKEEVVKDNWEDDDEEDRDSALAKPFASGSGGEKSNEKSSVPLPNNDSQESTNAPVEAPLTADSQPSDSPNTTTRPAESPNGALKATPSETTPPKPTDKEKEKAKEKKKGSGQGRGDSKGQARVLASALQNLDLR